MTQHVRIATCLECGSDEPLPRLVCAHCETHKGYGDETGRGGEARPIGEIANEVVARIAAKME